MQIETNFSRRLAPGEAGDGHRRGYKRQGDETLQRVCRPWKWSREEREAGHIEAHGRDVSKVSEEERSSGVHSMDGGIGLSLMISGDMSFVPWKLK